MLVLWHMAADQKYQYAQNLKNAIGNVDEKLNECYKGRAKRARPRRRLAIMLHSNKSI